MLGERELKGLELRRRELVLQSTLNRLALRMELENVQAALRPAERVVNSVRAARPWLLVMAPPRTRVLTETPWLWLVVREPPRRLVRVRNPGCG